MLHAYIRKFNWGYRDGFQEIEPKPYEPPEDTLQHYYILRVLQRFAGFFGLADLEQISEGPINREYKVRSIGGQRNCAFYFSVMTDPKNHNVNDEFDDEIMDEVNRIFANHPHEYIAKLEEIGFIYYDDDVDHEEQEEADARPLNVNQEYLVSFFHSDIPLSEKTVDIFLEERRSHNPNFPLIRKYFKQANKHLLSMLLYGLHRYPVSVELLSVLAFFHETKNILGTLIERYIAACELQQNLEVFSELALDFFYATLPDGYDALHALKEKYPPGTDKRVTIDFLIEMENSREGDADNDVQF